jgi:hypothetical protein
VPDALGELVGRWQRAEQRLYPVVLADPHTYERYVLAVRALADELAAVSSREALGEAFAGAPARALTHLRAVGGPLDEQSAGLVAGSAFALRERELAHTQAASERESRVADAARSGAAWVVVAEAGEPTLAHYGHYRRLEMHLPDGMGLYAYAEVEAEAARPVYVVERVPLDPASGRALGEAEQRWTFEDRAAWGALVEELRAALDHTA